MKNKGITLIALIITIMIMLILVGVSIAILISSDLIDKAQEAGEETKTAYEQEQALGKSLDVGGVKYNGINEYVAALRAKHSSIDWEKILEDAEKHPDQEYTEDIGVGTDGNPVNLDLWYYVQTDDGDISLGEADAYGPPMRGYDMTNIIDGKIQGTVPQYIKIDGESEFRSVTTMYGTFFYCDNLTEAPKIPDTVTDMSNAFNGCYSLTKTPEIPNGVTKLYSTFSSCESLTKAPEIPNSVNNMDSTFHNCESLTEAPIIPSSVTDMTRTFYDCRSLTEAPDIPSSVTNMNETFQGCSSLTGDLVINANPTTFSNCLEYASTNSGCDLKLSGTSTKLSQILATKSSDSHISLK